MTRARRFRGWIAALAAVALAHTASAQTRAPSSAPPGSAPTALVSDADRAAAHDAYEKGKAAFEARDYLRAAQLFLDAYEHAPHHDPLWNAARALELGGEAARAANLYTRYLDEAPEGAKDRDRATSARKELAARLGRLDVHAAGVRDVRIDGVAADGLVVYVAPGEHVVVGRAADSEREVRARTVVAAGGTASVVLAMPPVQQASEAAIAPRSAPATKPLPPAVVYVGAGVTAVLATLTVVSGLDTLNAKHRYETAPTPSLLDDGRAKEARTNVAFWTTLAAGALTGAAAIFFVAWGKKDATLRARAGLVPGALTFAGTFP